jgi:hypothetical protein
MEYASFLDSSKHVMVQQYFGRIMRYHDSLER